MRNSSVLLLGIILLFALGCSGGTPTAPTESESQVAPDTQEMQVLFAGTMNLDDGTVLPNRELEGYLNVTGYVGSNFSYHINGWLEPGVLDITLNLHNPTAFTVFDVSIVFENLYGKQVLNHDGKIDIYGPYDLDPIIAFGKGNPGREFLAYGDDSQPLHLTFPGSSAYVDYFIIAHFGGNTGGVWDLLDWNQNGTITPSGGNAEFTVRVKDYQNNVSSVIVDTTALIGTYTFFAKEADPEVWGGWITNTTGAPAGEYLVIVKAVSPAVPAYSYYDIFPIVVSPDTTTGIEPLFSTALPSGDTAFDVCVAPNGYAFVLADHPATGNVGGVALDQGTRTALRYANDLTGMTVIAPGTGIVDPFDAYGDPWANWPGECTRLECSNDGVVLNANVGRQIITYLELIDYNIDPLKLQGTYAWCGVHGFDTTMIDVCTQIADDGIYTEVLYGFGELPDPCDSGSGIPLGDQRTMIDRTDYFITDVATSPDSGLLINDNLVAIDGWDNTNDTVLFMSGPDMNTLVVYVASTFGGIASLVEGTHIYEGQFTGQGLDVAVDSAGNIVTLETPNIFRKFDTNYDLVYASNWSGNGTPMAMDFDRADDILYVLSTTHVTACSVQ